jgi:hypothetical protein
MSREPNLNPSRRAAFTVAVLVALGATTMALSQDRSAIAPASPVEAKLVIPDTKLLPGVPFEMWVELRNSSDGTVGVGLCADMLVRPEGSEPFTISFGRADGPPYPTLLPDANGWGKVTYLRLRPRQAEILTLPVEARLDGPAYFRDHRLSAPGRYEIALRLDYCWSPAVVPQKSLLPADFFGAVVTNEVAVERIIPSGVDAKVWQRMLEVSDGKWMSANWNSAVTGEILNDHRESNYYPYALMAVSMGAVDATAYERLVDAIKRFPTSPVVEMLELNARGISSGAGKGMAAYRAHHAKLQQSKRPTTRVRAFGREDAPAPPCPAGHDCTD